MAKVHGRTWAGLSHLPSHGTGRRGDERAVGLHQETWGEEVPHLTLSCVAHLPFPGHPDLHFHSLRHLGHEPLNRLPHLPYEILFELPGRTRQSTTTTAVSGMTFRLSGETSIPVATRLALPRRGSSPCA